MENYELLKMYVFSKAAVSWSLWQEWRFGKGEYAQRTAEKYKEQYKVLVEIIDDAHLNAEYAEYARKVEGVLR